MVDLGWESGAALALGLLVWIFFGTLLWDSLQAMDKPEEGDRIRLSDGEQRTARTMNISWTSSSTATTKTIDAKCLVCQKSRPAMTEFGFKLFLKDHSHQA